MVRSICVKSLFTAGVLSVVFACGAGPASGWGGSSSSWTSLNLNLTPVDCAKCHLGSNIIRHHALINGGKQCLDCHKMVNDAWGQYTVQVVRECMTCHKSAVHDTVKHVVNTCGSCHGSDIVQIHSGRRSASGDTLTSCYLCHTSIVAKVKTTIAIGVAGQPTSCTDCHGSNPHRWGGGSWGR